MRVQALSRVVSLILALSVLVSSPSDAKPSLDTLVGQLSQPNIEAHVNALAANPRDTPAAWTTAAAYIESELVSYGYTVVRTAVASAEGNADNLSATLTGTTTPADVFILGAHYDSVDNAPGADDNASGVAGMLEIARVLQSSPMPWTIEFVAYAHEEKGLLGSTVHAASSSGVVGMISLEMIGYTCPAPCQFGFPDIPGCFDVSAPGATNGNFIGAVVNDASAALANGFQVAASRYSPSLLVGTAQIAGTGACLSDTRRSDHAPYWDLGIPAMMLTDTANFRNANYHDPTDTPATIDFAFTLNIARATLALAATRYVPTDVPVAAKKLLLIDKPSSGKSKLVLVAKDGAIAKGAGGNITLVDAALDVFYSNTPVDHVGVLTVPAPWDKNDDKVGKYKNKSAPTGGRVKVGIVKDGKSAKIVAKGLGDGLVMDIISAPPGTDGLTTILTMINENDGTLNRYCTRFSTGDGSSILYKEIAGGTGRKLLAKDGVGIVCP